MVKGESKRGAIRHRASRRSLEEIMVSTNLNQGSARIYQFPVGGRAGLPGYRDTVQPAESTARVTKAVASSNWYHEAAVLEDCSKPQ
jgi:hypothetical protein